MRHRCAPPCAIEALCAMSLLLQSDPWLARSLFLPSGNRPYWIDTLVLPRVPLIWSAKSGRTLLNGRLHLWKLCSLYCAILLYATAALAQPQAVTLPPRAARRPVRSVATRHRARL